MRIIPVINNYFTALSSYKNNQYDYSQYRFPVLNDSVSFSSRHPTIDTHEKFRKLMIWARTHCLYCKKTMSFDDDMINLWKRQKLFSSPVGNFVEVISPHKESLMDTERAVFSIIENISKKNSNVSLSSVIKMMSIQANKKLLEVQTPILQKITETASVLPEDIQQNIAKLIEKNRCRMLKIPYIDEFSPKEFAYKIKNILKTMPNDRNVFKLKRLYQTLTLPQLKHPNMDIDGKTTERIERHIGFNMDNRNFKLGRKVKSSRKKLLELIVQNIKQTAVQTGNKDLIRLCEENEKRLYGLPTTSKFSNKSFIYDLSEALENCDNNTVKAQLFQLANSLPKSDNSIHAFIAKHDQASSSTIAYNLLAPSAVTLEHMKPLSEGGFDKLKNWAGAHKRCNNVRQSKDMAEYYKIFHPQNAQAYWDDIINLANEGYFTFKEVKEMMQIFQKQSHIKVKSKNLRFRNEY